MILPKDLRSSEYDLMKVVLFREMEGPKLGPHTERDQTIGQF